MYFLKCFKKGNSNFSLALLLMGEDRLDQKRIETFFDVHPPQQIHDFLATNHISQIVLQVTFLQYLVKLFQHLRTIHKNSFRTEISKIRREILNSKRIRMRVTDLSVRACICCVWCTYMNLCYFQLRHLNGSVHPV